MARSAGILLPGVFFAVGVRHRFVGGGSREFLDFLRDAGQSWWQMLPLTPGGGGNSPYSSVSSFAGNPLLLDLPLLREDGLLTAAEVENARVPAVPPIDYGAVLPGRERLLRAASAGAGSRMSRGSPPSAPAAPGWRTTPSISPRKAISAGNAGWTGRTRPSGTTRRRRWKPGGKTL